MQIGNVTQLFFDSTDYHFHARIFTLIIFIYCNIFSFKSKKKNRKCKIIIGNV